MPYLVSNDSYYIKQSMDPHDDYDLHRWRHICKYCHDMEIAINESIEFDDSGDRCYLVRDARHTSIIRSYKTEQVFMKNIGDHLEGVKLLRFIMKMEEVVKEYDERFKLNVNVAGNIARLYRLWIYAITEDINFEIIELVITDDEGDE